MKLAQLQQSFQDHVLRDDPRIVREISGDERFATAMRLGIYTDAYAARLIEVLAATFPAVQAALGASLFARLVGEFVRQHPSRFRSARAYGEELPRWLRAHLAGTRARGIADLGRFEWAVAGAFDAADQAALTSASLAGLGSAQWPQLRFAYSPTVRRLSVTSNCVAWWQNACADAPRPSRWRSTGIKQWLVWRRDLAVFYRGLCDTETQALDAALAGATFGQLCERLSTPAVAARMLQGWFNAGLIIGVS
ncbi:MAG TPA: DNA-binding domain-containing protein [Steroidobacteraceae bacterium]